MSKGPWTIVHLDKPVGMNEGRQLHRMVRAAHDRTWRHAFAMLAKAGRIPAINTCTIQWVHERPNRRSIPDTAYGCAYSAKAALDGLVDARVIPDDNPNHVIAQTFRVAITGRHALTAVITEAE